jgi:hypothetical protein
MAEIVNLRQFRKQKARAEAGKTADANRALFGRSKADKMRDRAETQARDVLLDGHRRELKPTDET